MSNRRLWHLFKTTLNELKNQYCLRTRLKWPPRGIPHSVLNVRRLEKARQELYGDKTVPRIRRERRYGGSSHSRAYLKKALCLYSDRAQVFFENNYERVNADLIVSTLVLEAVGGTDFANEISVRIEKEFNTLEKKMMHANAELERVATARHCAGSAGSCV